MKRVAIAGATGFIGRALCKRLQDEFHIIGLTRNAEKAGRSYPDLAVEWRSCDLFSLRDAELTLREVDYAVYLVHSMAPAARLTQASFDDLDLILADNFARAAQSGGVQQIVYLGGIIPKNFELSDHLRSRLEVERALASRDVALTAVRAGLVMGAGGSSFEMLLTLVRRLPMLGLPSWTRTPMSPVSREDIVEVLARSVGNEETYGVKGDVGSIEPITYEGLLRETARALGVRRLFVKIPLLSPGLSKAWVQTITGSPKELVAPLVSSLKCPMAAERLELMRIVGITPTPAFEALQTAIRNELSPQEPELEPERSVSVSQDLRYGHISRDTRAHALVQRQVRHQSRKEVRSVQRLSKVPDQNARWIAREYQAWLPRAMHPFMTVRNEGNTVGFYALWMSEPLLELTLDLERSPAERPLFYITGGKLADTSRSLRGRLEFRSVLDGEFVLAAIHEFTPSLPWVVYRWTQANIHGLVMWLFGRHLHRVAVGKSLPDSPLNKPQLTAE